MIAGGIGCGKGTDKESKGESRVSGNASDERKDVTEGSVFLVEGKLK